MFIANTRVERYQSPHHDQVIDLIENHNPQLITEQTHILLLPELCPASKNPGKGSELHIRYQSQKLFLELFSLERYIAGFREHPLVRDIEFLAQEVAKDCANALGEPVSVDAYVNLAGLNQRQIIKVKSLPEK